MVCVEELTPLHFYSVGQTPGFPLWEVIKRLRYLVAFKVIKMNLLLNADGRKFVRPSNGKGLRCVSFSLVQYYITSYFHFLAVARISKCSSSSALAFCFLVLPVLLRTVDIFFAHNPSTLALSLSSRFPQMLAHVFGMTV
mmetsp:Transcript_29886/g.114739  ORF Transcript_29886/g.114739 Transcript_29886/m.114739 type:complete len:140 (+) Transcript_29886:1803-2222(+)